MVEVIWTQNATDEIVRIAEYLERYSEYYASMIVKRLYEKVAVLKQFPIPGRVISEMQED